VTTAAAVHGRPWRRLRAAVLAQSDRCHICGHPGSQSVDHLVARVDAPHRTLDPSNVAPAHGVEGCPTCGRRCNQSRGTGQPSRAHAGRARARPPFPTSRPW